MDFKPGSIMVNNDSSVKISGGTPIEQALMQLDNALGLLNSDLAYLHQRLQPYMSQQDGKPLPNPSTVSPRVGSSVAVSKIGDLTDRVCSMITMLVAAKERLEV